MKPYKIIQELESDNSRLFKEGVIAREMLAGNDEFFEGIKIALDKLYVFNIQKVDTIKEDAGALGLTSHRLLMVFGARRYAERRRLLYTMGRGALTLQQRRT